MTNPIKQTLERVIFSTDEPASPETLERVGRCIAAFIQGENRGEPNMHPEAAIVELPIQDHETARKCFDVLEFLRETKQMFS